METDKTVGTCVGQKAMGAHFCCGLCGRSVDFLSKGPLHSPPASLLQYRNLPGMIKLMLHDPV